MAPTTAATSAATKNGKPKGKNPASTAKSASVKPTVAAKRGRPAVGEEKLRKSITFRMNNEERKLIRRAAKDMTLTETSWIRRAILIAAKDQLEGQKK